MPGGRPTVSMSMQDAHWRKNQINLLVQQAEEALGWREV